MLVMTDVYTNKDPTVAMFYNKTTTKSAFIYINMLPLLMLSAMCPPAALLTQRTDKKMNSEKINCIVIIKRTNTANNEIIKYAELWLLILAKCADVKIRAASLQILE